MADPWNEARQAHDRGEISRAYELCNLLLDQDPQHFGALSLMGVIALSVGQAEQALVLLDQALRLVPDEPSALVNRGAALHRLGHRDEAVLAYRAAVSANPVYAHAWYNLGTTLKELGRLEEALDCLQRCIEVDPEYQPGHFNLANTLYDLKRFRESLVAFDRALALKPDDAEIFKNRSFARLMIGDFAGGLEDFEWRWRTPPLQQAWRERDCPQWDGHQSLVNKAILVHAEQGLGDTLQFCRFLREVKRLGAAQVVFEVQKPVVHLMRSVEGADIVIPQGLQLPAYDFHIPLMSLPRALGLRADNVPAAIPYLQADRRRITKWAKDLECAGFKVGICWQGSAKGTEVGKGIPLSAFAPLAQCPGVTLFSLQKRSGESESKQDSDDFGLISFSSTFDGEIPFADTAAVMTCLDLVVTTDTSVAHLAGGLGIPVWVALPHLCDWRWGPSEATTPWYPTMRLFRQPRRGDWVACFAEITQALHLLLRLRSQPQE